MENSGLVRDKESALCSIIMDRYIRENGRMI